MRSKGIGTETEALLHWKQNEKNFIYASDDCTRRKTKPKANPNKVIPKQHAAVVKISPIIVFNKWVNKMSRSL